jgi:hypothetical protein
MVQAATSMRKQPGDRWKKKRLPIFLQQQHFVKFEIQGGSNDWATNRPANSKPSSQLGESIDPD